jgi:Carboxylesterase family
LQYRQFAESAGCTGENTFECLQRRSSNFLQRANQRETERAGWGKFNFGPAVDRAYVRDLPGRELLNGNFVKNVSILQGHNEWFLIMSMLIVEMRD